MAFNNVRRNLLQISAKILRVIQDLFFSKRAKILISRYRSRLFDINNGVVQCTTLGPFVFLINLLESLDTSGLGATAGSLHIVRLGFRR